jgi:flagellar hook protein FlgE
MASTTALFTGLSGLNSNSRNLDVIGNNISNVNTFGYKSNKMLFSTMFSRTMSTGTPPGESSGGTNPSQVGLGVQIAGTQRSFTNGALTTTGDSRDLAIEGNGFFVVQRGDQILYTRNGAFRPNSENDLTTISGERLMGWGVDSDFNVVTGDMVNVNVPLGQLTIAQATSQVRFSGNLNAGGALPTQGTRIAIMGTSTNGLQTISTAVPAPTPPDIIDVNSRLVDIEDPASPGSDTPYFVAGESFRLTGAQKGGKTLPDAEMLITATTTVQDLMDFMDEALGITTGQVNPDGGIAGLELDPSTGQILITGNTGSANDVTVEIADLRVIDAAGAVTAKSLHTDKTASSDGESVRTTFTVFDSLGGQIDVDMTMVLESKGNGTTWRYYVESGDDSDIDLVTGGGTVTFDTEGRLSSTGTLAGTIDRVGTGSDTPLGFTIELTSAQQAVTALTSAAGSQLAATSTDGAPIGTLSRFSVGGDGIITGAFTNGMTRTLGQVVLATFSSSEGLVDFGGNMFAIGANSGTAVVSEPLTLGGGRVVGGALELSNVDLGQEFINLILAQTGYSASARVITTTNDLMQQLLALGR